jgi:hypothetical protein
LRVFLWTGERELVRSILGLWRDLREVRRKQGFTITSHKLTIHKEAPDQHQDLKVVFSNVFIYFFGGLEFVGHCYAYVAHFLFLRDVWI